MNDDVFLAGEIVIPLLRLHLLHQKFHNIGRDVGFQNTPAVGKHFLPNGFYNLFIDGLLLRFRRNPVKNTAAAFI